MGRLRGITCERHDDESPGAPTCEDLVHVTGEGTHHRKVWGHLQGRGRGGGECRVAVEKWERAW